MRPTFAHRLALTGAALAPILAACDPDPASLDAATTTPPATGAAIAEPVTEVDTNRQLVARNFRVGDDLALVPKALQDDASGTVFTGLWECETSTLQSHQALACSVDPDFVLVGGGARTVWTGAGALLTGSFPSTDLTRWEGRSKDHGAISAHSLKVWAIGLKLSGVTRGQLRGHMGLSSQTSGVASHPAVEVQGPAGFLALGGGARVNQNGGAGGLLTRSNPGALCQSAGSDCARWQVGGKDHLFSNPTSITGFVITILPTITGFGALDYRVRSVVGNQVTTGISVAEDTHDDDFVVTGWGGAAFTIGSGAGRMLFGLGPLGGHHDSSQVAAKDHIEPSGGIDQGFTIELRRK